MYVDGARLCWPENRSALASQAHQSQLGQPFSFHCQPEGVQEREHFGVFNFKSALFQQYEL